MPRLVEFHSFASITHPILCHLITGYSTSLYNNIVYSNDLMDSLI